MAKGRTFTERELDIMSILGGKDPERSRRFGTSCCTRWDILAFQRCSRFWKKREWYATSRKGEPTGTLQW